MTYTVKQKILALNTTYNVLDENGENVYKIKRNWMLSWRYSLRDANKNVLMELRKRPFHFFPTFDIAKDDQVIATIKARFRIFESRFDVMTRDGGLIGVDGNVWAHDYYITKDGAQIAHIYKKFIAVRDTYLVDVYDDNYALLALCLSAVADLVHHEEDNS